MSALYIRDPETGRFVPITTIKGEPGEPGAAGVSPKVNVTQIDGGHRVTITDADGESSFDVLDGAGGTGGVSEEAVFDLLNKWGVIQSVTDADGAYLADADGEVLTYEQDISAKVFEALNQLGVAHALVDHDGAYVANHDNAVLMHD